MKQVHAVSVAVSVVLLFYFLNFEHFHNSIVEKHAAYSRGCVVDEPSNNLMDDIRRNSKDFSNVPEVDYKFTNQREINNLIKKRKPFVVRNFLDASELEPYIPANLVMGLNNNDKISEQVHTLAKLNWRESSNDLRRPGTVEQLQPVNDEIMSINNVLLKKFDNNFIHLRGNKEFKKEKHVYEVKYGFKGFDFSQCTAKAQGYKLKCYLIQKLFPKLKSKLDANIARVEPQPVYRVQLPYFFFGQHYDCYDNWLIQLHGKKHVVAYIYEQKVDSKGKKPLNRVKLDQLRDNYDLQKELQQAMLLPGDMLFLPLGWFHAVETIGCKTSIFVNTPSKSSYVSDIVHDYFQLQQTCNFQFLVDYPQRVQDLRANRDSNEV